MHYEGDIYRPPSEAYSLLLQATVGCAHNKCTFCNMFKAKQFHIRHFEQIKEDIDECRAYYRYVGRVFLCDGDALCLSMDKLTRILEYLNEVFPECEQINIYGRATDVLRKSPEDLAALRDLRVKIIYIGGESGSDEVLKRVNKGETRQQLIDSVHRVEDAGIKASVSFISGLGGKDLWREHAIETGTIISEMNPSYAALLTLVLDPIAPLYDQIQRGEFQLLTPEEIVEETKLLVENINVTKPCIFRSNHVSNYVNLAGTLPQDKEYLMADLQRASERAIFKDERFRRL